MSPNSKLRHMQALSLMNGPTVVERTAKQQQEME
jgi:hypothetical protein